MTMILGQLRSYTLRRRYLVFGQPNSWFPFTSQLSAKSLELLFGCTLSSGLWPIGFYLSDLQYISGINPSHITISNWIDQLVVRRRRQILNCRVQACLPHRLPQWYWAASKSRLLSPPQGYHLSQTTYYKDTQFEKLMLTLTVHQSLLVDLLTLLNFLSSIVDIKFITCICAW